MRESVLVQRKEISMGRRGRPTLKNKITDLDIYRYSEDGSKTRLIKTILLSDVSMLHVTSDMKDLVVEYTMFAMRQEGVNHPKAEHYPLKEFTFLCY